MTSELAVGLEIHVALATGRKLFCPCPQPGPDTPPNRAVCPVCLGHPGAMPRLDPAAVRLAATAALALGCELAPASRFVRKRYRYPDLPKGFQWTQTDRPLSTGGAFDAGDGPRAIARAHLEEDAGRLRHDAGRARVDLNRAGVPLLEVVTAPDFVSGAAARGFVAALAETLREAGVGALTMAEGTLRCDVNVSTAGGAPVEVKNLNSLRAIARAVDAEAARQAAVRAAGGAVRPQTRGWDEAARETVAQRDRLDAGQYTFAPEPNLPAVRLDPAWVAARRAALPEPPLARRRRVARRFDLAAPDARVLAATPATAAFFEAATAAFLAAVDATETGGQAAPGSGRLPAVSGTNPPLVADPDSPTPTAPPTEPAAAAALTPWVREHLRGRLALGDTYPDRLAPAALADLVRAFEGGRVDRARARALLAAELETPGAVAAGLAAAPPPADDAELRAWARAAIAAAPAAAAAYRGGKARALGALVAELSRRGGARACPKRGAAVLREELAR